MNPINLKTGPLTDAELQLWADSYNQINREAGCPFLSIDRTAFLRLFLQPDEETEKYLWGLPGEQGLLVLTKPQQGDKLYLTYLGLRAKARHQGIGTALLDYGLQEVRREHPDLTCLEISYFDPVNLAWQLPGKPGVTHPNSPGVEVSCDAYGYFRHLGFREYARQDSYYLDLKKFSQSGQLDIRRSKCLQAGYEVRPYDAELDRGWEELLADLQNPMWTKIFQAELAKDRSARPILIAVKDHRVMGFAGPLDVEPSGRGYFAGLAVHSQARGLGLAGLLFYELAAALQELGASYLTLFTGEKNPAARVYQGAGCEVVTHWGCLRLSAEDFSDLHEPDLIR